MAIVSDPNVMMGKPVIKGTRITVESILERMAAGETEQEVLEAHPRLLTGDIRDALQVHGDAMFGSFSLITPGHIRIRRALGS